MIWSALFLISIAQGLFLIAMLMYKGSKNKIAFRLVITILILMILTNFGYLVVRTDLRNYIPQMFGVPFGMMLLFGPLFYFYSKAVIDNSFKWKKIYWLHFIPYLIQLYLNIPWLMMKKEYWIYNQTQFLSGTLPIRWVEKITFGLQDIHLFIYLFFTFLWIRIAKNNYGNTPYIISISSRIKWLKAFFNCFALFAFTVLALYIFVISSGFYHPVTNYIYTLVTSGIIYFIAYKLVMDPELISPGFAQKYRSYMQFENGEGEKYLEKINSLMSEKIYTDPDFNLSFLAKELGLPSHQLSKLINQRLNKSFNDLVNEYRVNEFISRMNNSKYQSYTIYGIAMDVGFSSKSSFNTAFKKMTGKTPSEYKTI